MSRLSQDSRHEKTSSLETVSRIDTCALRLHHWANLPSFQYFSTVAGRPFVKRFALCCQTVVCICLYVCLSCLSVCDVGVLWPNGWTDQDETWHAGRSRPGHIVLGGDPALPPPKGHNPPIFGPYLLRPNGCMDQDATRHGARPRPRRLCVR